jgi:hypothetical protein
VLTARPGSFRSSRTCSRSTFIISLSFSLYKYLSFALSLSKDEMVASTKIKRSLVGGLWDRLAGYFYKLPSEQNSYTITPVSIPLRDSTSLAGDLYEPILPSGSRPVGTVLHFTPYGRTLLASTGLRPLAPRGYQVLNVSARVSWGYKGSEPPGRIPFKTSTILRNGCANRTGTQIPLQRWAPRSSPSTHGHSC